MEREFANRTSQPHLEERSSLLLGWYREPSAGHGLSAGLTVPTTDNINGSETTTGGPQDWLGIPDGQWHLAVPESTDLVFEDAVTTIDEINSWRLINNFNANRRYSAATQLSLQYAFKYVRSDFDGDAYTGYTDLVGVDLRRGIRGRWDMGFNASVYHSYQSDVMDYGFGVDVGFNLRDNMWLTLGYNVTGFHDSDFSAARYTAQGPYLRFSVKADQHTLKRIAGR